MPGENLDARESTQRPERRPEQEEVGRQMMRVVTELVDDRWVSEQRVSRFEEVREPAAVEKVGIVRKMRVDPARVNGEDRNGDEQDEQPFRNLDKGRPPTPAGETLLHRPITPEIAGCASASRVVGLRPRPAHVAARSG